MRSVAEHRHQLRDDRFSPFRSCLSAGFVSRMVASRARRDLTLYPPSVEGPDKVVYEWTSEYGTRYMRDADGETWAQVECSWQGCDALVPPFRTRTDLSPRRYCSTHREQGQEREMAIRQSDAKAVKAETTGNWIVAIIVVILVMGYCSTQRETRLPADCVPDPAPMAPDC